MIEFGDTDDPWSKTYLTAEQFQKMARYRNANPENDWTQLWKATKSLPPMDQLIAKDKLTAFYAKNISKSRHSLSSKKKQETEDAKTAETLSFRDLCPFLVERIYSSLSSGQRPGPPSLLPRECVSA